MGGPRTSRYVCGKNRKSRTGLEMMLGHKTSKPFVSFIENIIWNILHFR